MDGSDRLFDDRTPGVGESEPTASYLSYTAGLGLAILATIASFVVSRTNLLWAPGIPVGLVVLAFAQIGVHLVFFLHLGTGPDHTNNILALAFGVLIVFLVITGSIWIIAESQQQHDADVRAVSGESHHEQFGRRCGPVVEPTCPDSSPYAATRASVGIPAITGAERHRPSKAAERFWSPNYVQHSAHIAPGREGLFNLIEERSMAAFNVICGRSLLLYGARARYAERRHHLGRPDARQEISDLPPRVGNVLFSEQADVIAYYHQAFEQESDPSVSSARRRHNT